MKLTAKTVLNEALSERCECESSAAAAVLKNVRRDVAEAIEFQRGGGAAPIYLREARVERFDFEADFEAPLRRGLGWFDASACWASAVLLRARR
jgi:hypothetical protein